MRHHRRIGGLRRTLKVEALEDRTLLSGIVLASVDLFGVIDITGDSGNNAITISQISPAILRVSGDLNLPPPPGRLDVTSVNGRTYHNFDASVVTGINIQLQDGNDKVTMTGLTIPGKIVINAGSGQDTFTLNTILTNGISITGAGSGADTISLDNIQAGKATIATGTGAAKVGLDNVAIGTVDINTGTGTANDSVTISNSPASIGMLTIKSGDGNDTIGVTATSLVNASITAGNGNNTITLDGSTMWSAHVTAGTGSNLIDVSNDTFNGDPGLTLKAGLGGTAVQTIKVNNDTFLGGALFVSAGDGVPYFSPAPPALLPASSLTMINDVGIGTGTLTLGKFFQSVTLGGVSAKTLTAGIGDNADIVQINANVTGGESVTVGNAETYPTPPVPAPSVTLNGTVGTTLAVQVGNNWPLTVNATVLGDEKINPVTPSIGDSISVNSPSVGGDLNIIVGDATPTFAITGTTANNLIIQAGTGETYFSLTGVTVNNDMTFTTGDGDNTIALANVNVLDALSMLCGAGVNVVAALNVTTAFGDINAGTGPSNNYEDRGGNHGFTVSGVTGYILGPYPPQLSASDLSLSTDTTLQGNSVTLTGTFSQPNDPNGHTVTINWGDGSANTQLPVDPGVFTFSASHAYLDDGPAVSPAVVDHITVTLADSAGDTVSAGTSITVNDVPPVIPAGGLQINASTISEGGSVALSGAIVDPGITSHQVVINWGDGSTATTLNLGAGVLAFGPVSHTYVDGLPNNAPYAIQVTVNDEDQANSTASTQITVNNVSPANINVGFSNANINEGDTATLDGTFTDPNPQDTHTVNINWGDGSANTTLSLAANVLNFSANHQYLDGLPGNAAYTAQVTVSDQNSASGSANAQVMVDNMPPANIDLSWVNANIDHGETATLNGTFTDPAALDAHTVVINWGDGSANTTLALGANVLNFSANHQYLIGLPGNAPYTVQVAISDEDKESASADTTVTVVSPALTISGAARVGEGSPYTLNLRGQEAGGDTISGWTITWGDGAVQTATGNPGSVTHVYAEGPNSYTILAQASDQNGMTHASNTVAVQVDDVAPTSTLSGSASGNPMSPYTLNLSASDPGTDPITGWTINWGDGTTQPVAGNPSSATHSYALIRRSYTISALAINADGTFPAGNTVTVNMALATDNENFIAQVYLDLLNRAPELGGLVNWTDHLAAGASRKQVLEWIMISPEYRTLFVEGVYKDYLGREADSQGLRDSVLALDAGTSADQIKAGVLGSDEYFGRAGATIPGFFAALYADVLGRSGTPSEIQSWVQMEPADFARTTVASSFIGSTEANQFLVRSFYQKFLHRPADADGLNASVQDRKNGATEEDVIAAILASDEYFKHAVD